MKWDDLQPLADFSTEPEPDVYAAQPVLFATKDVNPDTRAKALSLQQEISLPVETIEANIAQIDAERAFNSFNLSAYGDTPITMAGLSHPQESPIYRDDAENLSAWERMISGVAKSWRAGSRNAEMRDISARKFWGEATDNDLLREKALDTEAKAYKSGGGFENFFAQIPAQIAEMAPLYLQAAAEAKEEMLAGGAAGAVSLGPGGALAGLALGLGGGTIIEMGKTEAYLAFKDFSQLKDVTGKPIDENAARGAAVMVGVVNGSLEALGGKMAMKLTGLGPIAGAFSRENLKTLMKIPTVQSAFAKVGRFMAGGMITEGATESMQEAVNVVLGEPLAAALNSAKTEVMLTSEEAGKERILQAGKGGAQVGAGFATPHTAIGALVEAGKIRASNQNALISQEMATLAEGSKTLQRMPEKWRDHIQAIKEQYGVTENVTVPFEVAETYMQEAGISVDQLKKEMPGTAESLTNAQNARSTVSIPIEEYAQYLARSENFQKYLPDVRMHPELPTDRETAELKSTLESIIADAPKKDPAIFDDLVGKLSQTETPEVADFQARLVASFFETQAEEMGIPAADLYGQYKIDFERSGLAPAAGDETFAQGANTRTEAFENWFDGSQVMDEKGEPLVVYHGSKQKVELKFNKRALEGKERLQYFTELEPIFADYQKTTKPFFDKKDYSNPVVYEAVEKREELSSEVDKRYGQVPGYVRTVLPFDFRDNAFKVSESGDVGAHFTPNSIVASKFSTDEGAVFPVYLSIKNLYRTSDIFSRYQGLEAALNELIDVGLTTEREIKKLRPLARRMDAKNFEDERVWGEQDGVRKFWKELNTLLSNKSDSGIVYENEVEGGGDSYIAFSPTQIKSIFNQGTWDGTNPDILKQGETDPRGFITMSKARAYFNITLTGKADLSTFLHESGHLFLELMNDFSAKPEASGRIVNDLQTIRDWVGAQAGEKFTRAHHEQFAKGFESYLMEGKAPSEELRSAFSRFRAWLTHVYKEMLNIGAPISDEIKGVFDRMLASQDAINHTAAIDKLTPLFDTAEIAGMTAEEHAAYVADYSKGMDDAEGEMQRRLMAEITASTRKQNAKAVEHIRATVQADVTGRPIYQALHFFKNGTLQDGTTPEAIGKMDRGVLQTMFPEIKFSGRLARATMQNGANPLVVSQYFGFSTPEEFVNAILEAPPVEQTIKAETKERLQSLFGDSMNPKKLAEMARGALHNDKIADMITRELRTLGNKINRPLPEGFYKAARVFANERIDATKISDIKPNEFSQAEQRYSKQAFDAASRNDWAAAAQAKRLQLLNHFLFRASTAARDEATGIRKYLSGFEKVEKRKKLGLAGANYLDAIDTILDGIELTHVSQRNLSRRQSLESYLKEMEDEGQIVQIPDYLRNALGLKNYRAMTMDEFRAVRDSVKNIDHLARLKNKLLLSADKRNFQEIMAELVGGIDSRTKDIIRLKGQNATGWEKFKARMRGMDAELLKAEFLIQQLDGKVAGKLHSLVFEPLAVAQMKKYDMLEAFNKSLYAPLRNMPAAQKARMAAEYSFMGTRMKGHEVMGVALNFGNAGNIKKLIEGYEARGYTEEKLQAELDRILTSEDWLLVQHIWNQLDTLWPEIAKLQKRNVGLEPPRVEPQKVFSKHGIFNGGYYPLMYDKTRVYKALQHSQQANDLFENNFMRPNVASGFAQERTSYVGALNLSLDALPKHINETIHYITHFEAVTQANRIVSHPEFTRAVSQSVGQEYYNEFRPWLQAIANDGKADALADFIDRFAGHTATGLSIMSMGFSLSTGVMQALGLSSSLSAIGGKYLITGLKGMLSTEQRSRAMTESKELRHVVHTFDRDARASYNEMLAMISGDVAGNAKYFHAKMTNFAFGLMGIIQREVNIATWIGAYNKAAADGVTDAAAYADSVVRTTQSGGGMKDLARIQRPNKPLRRLFTAYYTYFSVLYGQLRKAGQRLPAEPAIATAQLAALVLLPVVLEKLMRSGLPDDDEPADKWFKSLLTGVASFSIGTLPVARDVIQGLITKYDYGMSPGAAIMERGVAAAKKAATGEDLTESQIRALAKVAGLTMHLPANQFIKSFEYFDALLDGEVEEPIREFLFGVNKEAKR